MTEYWVSQAKYHCKVCNCYMADNKASRQHHENSTGHKIKVEMMMKQKRQEKFHGARSEQELKQQIAQIEQAAKAAMTGTEQLTGEIKVPSNFGTMRNQRDIQEAVSIKKEENSGIYKIRGKTYMDGTVFEAKLIHGTKCEIFVEDIDEWISGEILSRHEMPVPHTTVTLKSFDVKYTIPADLHPLEHEETRTEKKLKSDRIRILAGETEVNNPIIPYNETLPLPPSVAPKDEITGIGMWQTVSVKTVDIEEEQLAYEAAVKEMMEGGPKEEEIDIGGTYSKGMVDDDRKHHGKRMYKGFVIDDMPTTRKVYQPEGLFVPTLTGDQPTAATIQFKKRKITHPSHIPKEPTTTSTVSALQPITTEKIKEEVVVEVKKEVEKEDVTVATQHDRDHNSVPKVSLDKENNDSHEQPDGTNSNNKNHSSNSSSSIDPTVVMVPEKLVLGNGGAIQLMIKPKTKQFRKK